LYLLMVFHFVLYAR